MDTNFIIQKNENGVLAVWATFITILMVHIGSSNSIIERILNELEYFKTFGFTLILSFGALFILYHSKIKISEKLYLNTLILATLTGSATSFLTYLYFVFILDYKIEGSTLFTVDIPLIFFISFLTAFVFRKKTKSLQSQIITNESDLSESNTKIQGFRANSTHLIDITKIAFIKREHGLNYMSLYNGDRYRIEFALKELEDKLTPYDFFRLNRQTFASRNSIERFEIIEGRKLKVLLKTENTNVFVQVSKEKATSFKKWLSVTTG